MPLVRSIARPLLAATFVVGGIDALRHPETKVPSAEKVVSPLVARIDQLSSTEQVVKLDGAAKVIAGTSLAFGKFPRLSALVLATSLVPTTAAGHRFWEESDPARRGAQRLHFLKNAGMLGGLLLASVDTEGRPSIGWRLRRAPHALRSTGHGLRRDTRLALHSKAGSATGALHSAAGSATGALHSAAGSATGALHSAAGSATDAAHSLSEAVQLAAGAVGDTVRDRVPH